MFLAIDQVSKFAYVELHPAATMLAGAEFPRGSRVRRRSITHRTHRSRWRGLSVRRTRSSVFRGQSADTEGAVANYEPPEPLEKLADPIRFERTTSAFGGQCQPLLKHRIVIRVPHNL